MVLHYANFNTYREHRTLQLGKYKIRDDMNISPSTSPASLVNNIGAD